MLYGFRFVAAVGGVEVFQPIRTAKTGAKVGGFRPLIVIETTGEPVS